MIMNGTQNQPQQQPETTAPPPPANPGAYAPAPASVTRIRDSRSKSPVLASILSLMPGLGQVYIGYYQRGFAHAGIVAIMITALSTGDLDGLTPLVAISLAFFMLYNIIDAGRRAALYNQALAGEESIELPEDFKLPSFGGSIFGGAVLIGVGVILLMNTRFDISMAWIEEWWPMAPILLGVYLVVKAMQERSASTD